MNELQEQVAVAMRQAPVGEEAETTSFGLSVASIDRGVQVWDDFAQRAGASYLCSDANLRGECLRGHRVRRVGVFMAQQQIAQCAIVGGMLPGTSRRFVDRMQMAPGNGAMWPRAMQAVLRHLGEGRYTYGSEWNVEPPRAAALGALPGVEIESVSRYIVNAVDFSRWSDWAEYERALSTNAKRSAAKARKADPQIAVIVDHGLAAAIRHVCPLTLMRRSTNRRKGLSDVAIPFAASRYFLRAALMGENAFTARAVTHGRTSAYFSGIRFGSDTFYLHGASVADSKGGSWHLMLEMLRRAFRTDGRFMLGMYLIDTDWPGRDNILLSRRHCRATDFPNDVITFTYRPGSGS